MGELRRWALWVAVLTVLLAVMVCIGAGFFVSPPPLGERIAALASDPSSLPEGLSVDDLAGLSDGAFDADVADPPGLGIPALALTNGLLLIIVSLMALPLLIGNRVGAVANGVVSLIGGIIAVIVGIVLSIGAFLAVVLMVTLFLAAPFGTLAYLAVFGFFDVSTSAAILGLVLFLQIAAIVFLVIAQPKFLGNKRLILFLLLAVVLTVLTMALHSIVPIILVSITDAIAAIITAVVGVVWGLLMVTGALIALVKQLNLGRQSGGPLRSRDAGETALFAPQPPGGTPTVTMQTTTPLQRSARIVPVS